MAQIKSDVKEIVETEVNEDILDIYDEEVIRMYNEYTPSVYERRYDQDGFGDKEFWISDTKARGNNISYKMTNEAKAVKSRIRLDKIIEEGIYDYPGIPERPVYERSMERIEQERVVENTLEKELKKRGYELKR